jgi:hypothetical protein
VLVERWRGHGPAGAAISQAPEGAHPRRRPENELGVWSTPQRRHLAGLAIAEHVGRIKWAGIRPGDFDMTRPGRHGVIRWTVPTIRGPARPVCKYVSILKNCKARDLWAVPYVLYGRTK